MKVIIIGSPATGKTTLVRYLRKHSDLPLLELDEEIIRLNKGVWPKDDNYKLKVLHPRIFEDINKRDNVVFVASYYASDYLAKAKQKGFKVILLEVALETLKERNIKRMEEEKYEDAARWFEQSIAYQDEIKKKGLVGKVIDVSQPIEKIAEEILSFINAES